MTQVLGIDIGIKGGYAYGNGRGSPSSGVCIFSAGHGERWGLFQDWLRDVDADASPDLVVYERPCGKYNALRGLCGFVTIIEMYAAQTETLTREVPPKVLKQFATGNGNAGKPMMVAAARERWPELEIISPDHADALWLMAYGLEKEAE